MGATKHTLTAIKEALVSDSTNAELLAVHEELLLAIREAEKGLLHLIRSRLVRETDLLLSTQSSKSTSEDVKVEPLGATDIEAKPLEANYSVGSKCRFRHTDGRWYNGHIIAVDGSDSATISFLTPTSENMLVTAISKPR